MPLRKFCIVLNNSSAIFPGQVVFGGVMVNSECDVQTQGLVLKFEGKISVRWTEQRSRHRGSDTNRRAVSVPVVYDESYYVFDYTSFLLGDGNGTVQLGQGEMFYPFTFPVPFTNIPGTFHGDHGKVEYKLKATLKRRGLFADYHIERDIHINPVLDLNLEPMLSQPGEWHKSKQFCCFCCASGPLTMIVRLGAKESCLGECIQFTVEVNNNSTRKINDVSAELIQKVTYRANGSQKVVEKTVAFTKSGQEVEAGEGEIWRGNLTVPSSVPPTRLGGGCTIIDLEYNLKVVAHVAGTGINLKLPLPITLGTVPLRRLGFDQMAPPMPSVIPPSAPPAYTENPQFGSFEFRPNEPTKDLYASTTKLV